MKSARFWCLYALGAVLGVVLLFLLAMAIYKPTRLESHCQSAAHQGVTETRCLSVEQ